MRKREAQAYNPGPRPVVTLLILIGCVILLGAVFAAIKVFLLDRAGAENGIIQENGSIEVTFCQTQNCSAAMLRALQGTGIRCAFYELNHPAIIDRLAQVNAQVLVDEDNAADVHGLAVEIVPSIGLMHDKFCIINDTITTGSMNPTVNDVERNDNNFIIIKSPTLAARYGREFEELKARTDRTYKKLPPKPQIVNISGIVVEQYFCPQENCEGHVVSEVKAAKSEVAFMLFTFTSDPIGDAMLSASSRGVAVHGVVENRQADTYSEHPKLRDAGLDVRTDGNKYTMHHKVIVIDNRTVITGSFNPTSSANTKNDENMLIIHDEKIAALYMDEFNRVMAAAKP